MRLEAGGSALPSWCSSSMAFSHHTVMIKIRYIYALNVPVTIRECKLTLTRRVLQRWHPTLDFWWPRLCRKGSTIREQGSSTNDVVASGLSETTRVLVRP